MQSEDEELNENKFLPCPFCAYKKIRIIEAKARKGFFKGEKITYAWCPVCGTKGPWAYELRTDIDLIIKDCCDRWNERNGVKMESINKDKKWIDVHDQLPHDGEEVWVCSLCPDPIGRMTPPYFQCLGSFYRSQGWRMAHGFKGEVHYWKPKPADPDLPKWYVED